MGIIRGQVLMFGKSDGARADRGLASGRRRVCSPKRVSERLAAHASGAAAASNHYSSRHLARLSRPAARRHQPAPKVNTRVLGVHVSTTTL